MTWIYNEKMSNKCLQFSTCLSALERLASEKKVDSLGEVEVPADHYWVAQTQRSLLHFSIGDDHMPKEVYHAYGYVKEAAALLSTQPPEKYRSGKLN